MSRSIKTVALGQICSFKYGQMPRESDLSEDGYPVFSGYRIVGFSKKYHYKEPEIIVVARGVGGTGDVKMSPPFCFLTNLSIAILVKDENVDKRFLYYLLAGPGLWDLRTGSAQAQITVEHLSAYEVQLPPLSDQRRVADILAAYDSLIQYNTRRIVNLEETSRRMFDEWFVKIRSQDQGSGDRQVTRNIRVPTILSELAEDVRESADPRSVAPETPYVGLEHIPRCSTTLLEWGRADEVGSLKLRFRRGDTLFGKIRPYFHKAVIAPVNGVASSDAIVIRPLDPIFRAIVALLASSDAFVARAVQTSNGTKMPRADWKVLREYPITLPCRKQLIAFDEAVWPTIELAANLAAQNRNLRAQRDLLLPKLISGGIDVSRAKGVMEAAE